jgi:hypothetical protein
MSPVARYLSKILVGAVVGAVLGALVGEIIVGFSWGASAIIGGCIFASLSTLYGHATIHADYPRRSDR